MAPEGEKKGAMEAKAVADAGFIFLKGFDGVERRVSKAAASLLGLIRGVIDEVCADGGVFDLPRVAASTLDKVIEYCNKHAEPAAAAASAKPRFDPAAAAAGGSSRSSVGAAASGDLDAWDREFLGLLPLDDLYDLLLAASYLEIELLLDAICQKVADMIKGKTTQQIRATFNLTDDLTPAEEEELRHKYGWFFDE